jgi:hypothetical protein
MPLITKTRLYKGSVMKKTNKTGKETLALIKILAMGERQIAEGKVVPAAKAFAKIRKRHAMRRITGESNPKQ